jgi:hypothetical protein
MTTPIIGLSNAVTAKQALFDRFSAEADGGLLQGVSVSYAASGIAGNRSIYGGGWRIVQEDGLPEQPGMLRDELTAVSVYIRVSRAPSNEFDVEAGDVECRDMANVLARICRNSPKLAGVFTWVGISAGYGDYSQTGDEIIVIHSYGFQIRSLVTWGL